jgi:hypothetical protein
MKLRSSRPFCDDGNFEARPMQIHLRMFKEFLLYCKRKEDVWSTPISEKDVMDMDEDRFCQYCCSADYFQNAAKGDLSATTFVTNPNLIPATGLFPDTLKSQEFPLGVKRDNTHYDDLKDDKYFNSWNRDFVATAHMHPTHLILDESYIPRKAMEIAMFKEIQTFMYAVLEEHLKTEKGKSLVSQYEFTHDAQKKHALNSTAAQLSGDKMLQYITTTRLPRKLAWYCLCICFTLERTNYEVRKVGF